MRLSYLCYLAGLSILCQIFPLNQIQAQNNPTSNEALKQVFKQERMHDHRSCGTEAIVEAYAKEHPEFRKEMERFWEQGIRTLSEIKEDPSRSSLLPPIINIPVVVHVIHSGEAVGSGSNISEARIQAQIDVLNEDFLAMNANFNNTPPQWAGAAGNPEIQFCLASVDPAGNPSNGITRDNIQVTGTNSNNSNIENVIKPQTTWNSNLYYNIWTVAIPGTGANGGVTGYAYYPNNGTIGGNVDGSVVDWRWFGGPGFGQSGDKTLTHETGHYLGLRHTFNGNSCGADDNIADTPNIDAGTSNYVPGLNCSLNNFPAGPTSCGNAHMYVNYMDYVNDDDCYTSFTNNQISVMRAVLNGTAGQFGFGSRLPLANNSAAVCTNTSLLNDAGISGITTPGAFTCSSGSDLVTPVVTLTNYGSNNLTTVTITYQVNGGGPVILNYVDNIAPLGYVTVSLAPFLPPAGNYTFTCFTSNPNGAIDEDPSNDQSTVMSTSVMPQALPLIEDFESPLFDPTVSGLYLINPDGDAFAWELFTGASAYGVGNSCTMFNNFSGNNGSNPGGTQDRIVTPAYDFSGVAPGTPLSFDVAYARYNSSGQFDDTLKVLVSTNCGASFDDIIFIQGGPELATSPNTTVPWTPNPNQWKTEVVDLSAYAGLSNVSFAFENSSKWGN
ncbi:MAG: M43 family zinc metalloprotease, partial [Saprospiraceae bacterium]